MRHLFLDLCDRWLLAQFRLQMFSAHSSIDRDEFRILPQHSKQGVLIRELEAEQRGIVLQREAGVRVDVSQEMERVGLEPALQVRGNREQTIRLEAERALAKLGHIGHVARLEEAPGV